MAWIETRKRSGGGVSAYVAWRLGGGSGDRQTETFSAGSDEQNVARAKGFKKTVEAAGEPWPDGWVKSEGFVRPGGGDPHRGGLGSTDALIPSVPASLSSVAGGVQQTASQLGGVVGTATLTTMVAAHVESIFRDPLAAAGVGDQGVIDQALEGTSRVSQGDVPEVAGASPETLQALTAAVQTTFVESMTSAMTVSWLLAAIGIVLALPVKRPPYTSNR